MYETVPSRPILGGKGFVMKCKATQISTHLMSWHIVRNEPPAMFSPGYQFNLTTVWKPKYETFLDVPFFAIHSGTRFWIKPTATSSSGVLSLDTYMGKIYSVYSSSLPNIIHEKTPFNFSVYARILIRPY